MKIGITGASGQLGNHVIEQLKKRTDASNLVALVRNPAKIEGIEARAFDYEKPEELASALEGIETLLLISGNEIGSRARQHENVISAAEKAQVKRIVYTSILRADSSQISLAGEHLSTELRLKSSDLSYTILRNGWYTENYTASIPGALQGGAFIGSAADGKIASANRIDYAEAAAVVLTEAGHEGQTYELAGDEAYTLSKFAQEISKQSGKDIPYQNLAENDFAQALKSFGIPDAFAEGLASWDVCASKGDLFDDGKKLSKLIARPTTPYSVAIKEALA